MGFKVVDYGIRLWYKKKHQWYNNANIKFIYDANIYIRCEDNINMSIWFLNPESPYQANFYEEMGKELNVFIPISHFNMYIDLLWNEKPIYANIVVDKPQIASLSANREPVGEGEHKTEIT